MKTKKVALRRDGASVDTDVASRESSARGFAVGQPRVFLLSPANLSGVRGIRIQKNETESELALRLRDSGVSLGEIFSYISRLYFRGKLVYAQKFAAPPSGLPGVYVITPCAGLVPVDTVVTLSQLRELCAVPIEATEPRYLGPLQRDARSLSARLGPAGQLVLLGSIATPKYVEPLLATFGQKVLFPSDFVGRGDMSRGGLMLRCANLGTELEYVSVAASVRNGPKPPRLPNLVRS
jgi:hypothetical protein